MDTGVRISPTLNHYTRRPEAKASVKKCKRRILLGNFVLSSSYYDAYYTKAQKVRRLIRDKTKDVFKDYNFIIMPTAPTTAFKLGELTDNPLEMYLADLSPFRLMWLVFLVYRCPCGNDAKGLPIGVQVIADDFQELELFQFSEVFLQRPPLAEV